MDVIDNANMQRIIDFLKSDDDNVSTFHCRKHPDHWVLWASDYEGTTKFQATGPNFSTAVKNLSHLIYVFNRDAGGNSNECDSNC